MSGHDNTNMSTAQSYPSPTAEHIRDPFWPQQQRLGSPDNSHLPAALARGHPLMAGSMNGNDEMSHTQSSHELQQATERMVDLQQESVQDTSFGDAVAPRKRSKVSRACDECRRKKIRCDATSDSGEQCSSCRRGGIQCQFSRVPMKRGPSKGYIKELADRLMTLENSMGHSPQMTFPYMDNGEPSQRPEVFSPSDAAAAIRQGRKRSYSQANEFSSPNFAQPYPQRTPHGGQERVPLQQPGSAPQAPMTGTFESHLRNASQYSPNGVRSHQNDTQDRAFEWDQSSIDEYYRLVHPLFPLLPHSKSSLRNNLNDCPAMLRDAFLEALYTCARSFSPNTSTTSNLPSALRATDQIASSQFDQTLARNPSGSLIYLQGLILMALASDIHGPTAYSRNMGQPTSVWLSSAVGLCYFLRLHTAPKALSSQESDNDENVGRRAWSVLVILDRLHALSTATPVLIPDSVASPLPVDQSILGDLTYYLLELSLTLGHIAEQSRRLDTDTHRPAIAKSLIEEVTGFKKRVGSKLESLTAVNFSLSLIDLLLARFKTLAGPKDFRKSVEYHLGVLESLFRIPQSVNLQPLAPLYHHFASLAVLTVLELADYPETREDAHVILGSYEKHLLARKPSQDSSKLETHSYSGWETTLRELVSKTLHRSTVLPAAGDSAPVQGQGNLQRLADLAVGEGERNAAGTDAKEAIGGRAGRRRKDKGKEKEKDGAAVADADGKATSEDFDPTYVLREGYLRVLAARAGHTAPMLGGEVSPLTSGAQDDAERSTAAAAVAAAAAAVEANNTNE